MNQNKKETVVLLHGLARTARSMKIIESVLKKQGYATYNINYPSRKMTLDQIVEYLREHDLSENFWDKGDPVHFVTHSMGGLVAHRYIMKYKPKSLARVVMLGPPNQGSETADFLSQFKLYRWFFGPAGSELKTHALRDYGMQADYDLGVIAGTKNWSYLFSPLLMPGENDGLVSVESTKAELMKDHITLPVTHGWMIYQKMVCRQIIHFLETGQFKVD